MKQTDSHHTVCRLRRLGRPSVIVVVATFCLLHGSAAWAAERVASGLQALYTFDDTDSAVVRDVSGVGQPLNLKVMNPENVRRSSGVITIASPTVIMSDKPATKIIDAVRKSNEITVEAWVKSANLQQNGPARIVSLSSDGNQRNLTLGQDAKKFIVRLRTTSTSTNGLPPVESENGAVRTALTHIVYTRNARGDIVLYVDGKQMRAARVEGDVSNWDQKFHLLLANEQTKDRSWLGDLNLVALYSRSLSPQEVQQNFKAGSAASALLAEKHSQPSQSHGQHRVSDRLVALYSFDAKSGDVVREQSGSDRSLDLKIDKPSAVQWTDTGLHIRSAVKLQSAGSATGLAAAIQRASELTIEAWVKPENTSQNGPARIVSLSSDTGNRNVTLGQDGNHYDVRLRTTATDANGLPNEAFPNNSARTALTHVVYTRDSRGDVRLYVDGRPVGSANIKGSFANWNNGYPLLLANERTGERPWLGELQLVAIYAGALSAKDVQQNFRAGRNLEAAPSLADDRNGRLFRNKIAGVFANQCLECHDSPTRAGGLDLSHRSLALSGGESGKPIVPGKPEDSLLWKYVESNDMPADRPPLSDIDKKLLREWIAAGAEWPIEFIDPVVYLYEDQTTDNWIRRLTVEEYIETVRASVDIDISTEARRLLPRDLRADGFSNTAYNLNVDLKHVEAYAQLAKIIAERMDIARFTERFTKLKTLNTDNKSRDIVAAVGKWLLRGPLNDREITNYSGIATSVASAGGSFDEGMQLLVEAFLQSPRFVYRLEDQRGSGTVSVGTHELASRISYIVWGAPPDGELRQAAESGDLNNDAMLKAQVQRMLKDPRAETQALRFVTDWLNLNRLDNLQPGRDRFPTWTPELARDMKNETREYFRQVIWKQKRPLSDLLNAQVALVTPRLARHYGLEPKNDDDKVEAYDVSRVSGRGGLLTQGSLLTIGGDDASMVTRGLFVLHELLRGVVKAPPPCVNTTPPPTKSGVSQRTIAEGRVADSNCGGCHIRFEPLAYGLEKFDGIGAFSDQDEHGNPLREDGEVLFPGLAKPTPFKTSAELMDLLARSDRVRESLTWKVAQFAIGRPLGAADAGVLESVHRQALADGGTWSDTLTAVIMSDIVRTSRLKSPEER